MAGESLDPNAQIIRELAATYERMVEAIGRILVGQRSVIDQLLYALFSGGHCLLEGVPGLAKTLLVSTLARVVHLSFKRIQFTPDLMPSDITGTEILQDDVETGRRRFVFLRGPIFAHMILADEINRTPPKTQAALLEAMQEGYVTAAGQRYPLPQPFFVLATQNPIDQEGTYALPEAQKDRFMFNILLAYPGRAEEIEIMKRTTRGLQHEIQPVIEAEDVARFQQVIRQVVVPESIYALVADLVRSTRPGSENRLSWVSDLLAWGAGPRASQYLIMAAKTRALLQGRVHLIKDDIFSLAAPVLRHRIVLTFQAAAEGFTADKIIEKLLRDVVLAT